MNIRFYSNNPHSYIFKINKPLVVTFYFIQLPQPDYFYKTIKDKLDLGYSYTAIVKIRQGDSYKMAGNQFGFKYHYYDNNLLLLYDDVVSKITSLFK